MDKSIIKYNIKRYTRLIKEKLEHIDELYNNKDVPSYQTEYLNDYKASLRKYQAMLPKQKPKSLNKIIAYFQCASDGSALEFDI